MADGQADRRRATRKRQELARRGFRSSRCVGRLRETVVLRLSLSRYDCCCLFLIFSRTEVGIIGCGIGSQPIRAIRTDMQELLLAKMVDNHASMAYVGTIQVAYK